MQTMNQSLARLVERRVITREAALRTTSATDELAGMLARQGGGVRSSREARPRLEATP
jgi:hypothetical protein